MIKLHLIVSANPKAYSSYGGMAAGELAGTPEAFAYHLLNPSNFKGIRPGVFYGATIKDVGLAYYLSETESEDARTKLLRNFGTPVQVNGQKITVDRTGYFYEPGRREICYQFKTDGLRTLGEIRKDRILQRYLIGAHKKVALHPSETDWPEDKLEWLLIREMVIFEKPIETKNNRLNPFLIKTEWGEEHILYTQSVQPNAYVRLKKGRELPPTSKITCLEDLESEMLVGILSSRRKRFSEVTIHEIFKQILTRKGLYIIDEGHTSRGRFDIAYKDEKGTLVAIEFKVGIADNQTLIQLRGYMGGIKWEKKKNGVIIARSCKPSTKRKCELSKIRFIPYKLSLSFPGLFDSGPDENVSK